MNPSQIFQLQITDADGNERVIPLPATTSIGRQVGNDLLLDDQRISRRHAKIECSDEACHITDLGSSNGTTVDEEHLRPNVPVQLKPGSVVRIGSFELRLRSVPAPEPVVVQAVSLQPAADADAVPPMAAEVPPPTPLRPSAPPPPHRVEHRQLRSLPRSCYGSAGFHPLAGELVRHRLRSLVDRGSTAAPIERSPQHLCTTRDEVGIEPRPGDLHWPNADHC